MSVKYKPSVMIAWLLFMLVCVIPAFLLSMGFNGLSFTEDGFWHTQMFYYKFVPDWLIFQDVSWLINVVAAPTFLIASILPEGSMYPSMVFGLLGGDFYLWFMALFFLTILPPSFLGKKNTVSAL